MAVVELTQRGDATLRAELFVRSLAPETARPEQERVIERLRGLERDGALAALDLHVAGDCVCPSTVAAETETGRFLLERFEAFEAWAADHGCALVGFEDRCVDSSLTGETVTGIRFPRLCLAVFDDEELLLVAPASDGEASVTVHEAVERLSERRPRAQ